MSRELWRSLQMPPLYKVGAWYILNAGYSDPARAYHGWGHIRDLFNKKALFQDLATRPDLIDHAIFWHDAVYKTRNADGSLRADLLNVEESAALFDAYSLLPDTDKKAVFTMIMATGHHKNPPQTEEFYPGFARDRDLFIDLDLSGFAATPAAFDGMTRDIRHEYQWVPEKAFCLGRAKILADFAACKAIYKTPLLEERWGEQARANLVRSARELSAQAANL